MCAYSFKTRPNSDSNIEDEVHMTTEIVYVHVQRSRMSLTHANACAIMVHCECHVYISMAVDL
jgi:hypothetical protein